MNLFLHRKLGFMLILVFSLIFICFSSFYLSAYGTARVRRRVDTEQNYHNLTALIQNTINRKYSSSYLESFETHYFNIQLSDKLPLDRDIPDTRHLSCRNKEYYFDAFKTTSVILTYYNEARSTLMRTIISILNRTPPDLLREIILIDDFSTNNVSDIIHESQIGKVILHRNTKREGLIRSRNLGAQYARGDYIVFLDSHCEVNKGWLEPLLARLSVNPTSAISPIIDVIDSNKFVYRGSSTKLKGGFDWSLHFKWIPMTEEERKRRWDPTHSYLSPSISGGIFIISRLWFLQLGSFDSKLEIWGGESLELSIKLWLCGGFVEIAPCSRVGHVFRRKHPYSFPLGNTITYLRNSKRIAETWLDEFKSFYYSDRPQAQQIEIDSLDDVLAYKNKLNCRKFSWYLENVYTDLKIPNKEYAAFGDLRQGSKCLDIFPKSDDQIFLNDCSDDNSAIKWSLHKSTGALKTDNGYCLNVLSDDELVLENCDDHSEKWSRKGGTLIHSLTKKCLENLVGNSCGLSACRRGAVTQLWSFSVELQQL